MPNQAPRGAWQDVTLDFMTKLPPSKKLITGIIYNSIMVVINRLTKYAYFIPYFKNFSAEDLAYMFYKYRGVIHAQGARIRAQGALGYVHKEQAHK
jgi:hypothetical protein